MIAIFAFLLWSIYAVGLIFAACSAFAVGLMLTGARESVLNQSLVAWLVYLVVFMTIPVSILNGVPAWNHAIPMGAGVVLGIVAGLFYGRSLPRGQD